MAKYYSRSKQKFIDIATMTDQHVRNAFVQMCKHEPTEDVIYAEQQRERADNYKKLAEDNFASSVVDLGKIEKLIKQNNELQGMYDKLKDTTYQPYDNQGRVRDYQVEFTKLAKQRDKWKEKAMNMVDKSTHMELEKENKKLKLENTRIVDRLERDDHGIGEIERQRDDAIFDLKQERNRAMMYAEMLNDKCPNGHAYVFSEIPNDDEGREFVQKMKDYLNKESYKLRVKGQYLDEETKRTEGWRVHKFGQPISKSKCLRVYVDVKKE